MKVPGKIQLTVWLLGIAGAALFIAIIVHQDLAKVGAAFAAARWAIVGVVAYHFAVPIFLDAVGWWVLFPRSDRLPLRKLLWMRWIGESVSTLVPSAAVGGDVVRARLAAINGAPLPVAVGSVLVDLTLGVFTQAAFAVLGIVLLVDVTGQKNFVRPTLIGTLIGVMGVVGFYFVQRLGMFRFLASIIARLALARVAIARPGRRGSRPDHSRALCAAKGCDRLLCLDDCFACGGLRRNLDRTPRARSPRNTGQRANFAKYGIDDSVGGVCGALRFRRAGNQLLFCRPAARDT
jgi:hypothetical protein